MEELLFESILEEKLRPGYAFGGKITQGKYKGKYKFTVGRTPNVKTFYANNMEEGRAWEAKTRQRKILQRGKKFGSTVTTTEKNKAAQFLFKKNYNELNAKQQKKAYDRVYDQLKTKKGQAKFKIKTQDKPLTSSQQAKIKKAFPNAKFGPRQKYGFAPTDPEYNKVFTFAKRGFKRAFSPLPKYMQEELINAFPDVEFDFTRGGKYGVPSSETNLYKKIQTYFDDPKPYRFGFNLRTAGGWALSQMDRAAAQGDTRYEAVLQKPNKPLSKKNKIIAMKDKTGKTTKTYTIKNINKHPNFNEIVKYVDVANKSRTPLTDYPTITKLLPKGFDSTKIQLNDLLQYLSKDRGGINRAKRAVELHHVLGVKNNATGSFQLLRSDLNKLADTIEQQIRKGNLSRAAELDANRIRVETGGVKYGGKARTPQGDFRAIVKGVEQDLSKFKQRDFNLLKKSLKQASTTGKIGTRFYGGIPADPALFKELFSRFSNPFAGDLTIDASSTQLGTGRLGKTASALKNVAKIGGKALGIAAIPLEVANMLNMRKQGKTTAEILGSPFLLSGRIAEAQDLMKMTPLERQAVSEQQIAGDESMLDTDFYTPRQEGIEAVDIEAVQERVRKQREEEERQRALERSRPSGFTYPNMYGITSLKV
tara:strand:- start:198 stop:2144 length:1947 start_codon:yes stop_codon:yes gene_type:complete